MRHTPMDLKARLETLRRVQGEDLYEQRTLSLADLDRFASRLLFELGAGWKEVVYLIALRQLAEERAPRREDLEHAEVLLVKSLWSIRDFLDREAPESAE